MPRFGRRLVPFALLAAILAPPALGLTVRVKVRDGVPRILVDGKPVRPRMFFGIPGSGSVKVGPGERGKEIRFEFVSVGDAENGTFHIRCGHRPGEVDVDDLRVVDLTDGRDVVPLQDFEAGPDSFASRWTFWPPDERNTVGSAAVVQGAGKDGSAGLRITLDDPPGGGGWPDFHVYLKPELKFEKGRRYAVSLWVRSGAWRDLSLDFYRPGPTFLHLGGPSGPYEDEIKMAADAGVDFVSFPVDTPWPEPGAEADWSTADAACAQVLRVNPDALLLPRIGMYPPKWWTDRHPGDVMKWEDGARKFAVPASPRYLKDGAERLRALIEHLEAKFGGHMAGYHVCGQNTAEWFYEDTWGHALNGYAPADLAAWRAWLRAKYRTDDALRASWNDPKASLATVAAPSPESRHAAPNGVFRDPETEKPILDWSAFQQDAMAEAVLTFARTAREAAGGRKLVVFFYGYLFEFGAVERGPAVSGHYALRKVLASPDIDILCSPISYFDRGPGGSAPAMTAAESVPLAGKMWLCEDDTRTYLAQGSTFPGALAGGDTPEETIQLLLRNVGQEATRNFATWWMDLGATGWFDDPKLWAEMRKLEAIDLPMLNHPVAYRPEVAAVIDEESMLRVAAGGQVVTKPGVYEARAALARCGAPYGQYLIDDVIAGKVDAKLYVVLNAWSLTADQRAGLLKATRGKGVVWCYAPGLYDGDRPSPPAMRELTGFDLKPSAVAKAQAEITDPGRALGLTKGFGVDARVRPTFAATDAAAEETLARYPDAAAAVALRESADGGFSLFAGPPGLTSELVRLAARKAGAHLYADVDCNVYANGPFIVIHASQDGQVTLRLPAGKSEIVDAVDEQPPVSHTLELRRGDTRIFRFP